MSNEKTNEQRWGGFRHGAGRKPGITKAKRCVSVDETIWIKAVEIWKGKASRLVELLLTDYVKKGQLRA
jgi:hypothetical protein